MTKIIILGEEPKEEKELKKIEFVKAVRSDGIYLKALGHPSQYDVIELIRRNYGEFDLMFAYRGWRNNGCLYLGHFNDGIA